MPAINSGASTRNTNVSPSMRVTVCCTRTNATPSEASTTLKWLWRAGKGNSASANDAPLSRETNSRRSSNPSLPGTSVANRNSVSWCTVCGEGVVLCRELCAVHCVVPQRQHAPTHHCTSRYRSLPAPPKKRHLVEVVAVLPQGGGDGLLCPGPRDSHEVEGSNLRRLRPVRRQQHIVRRLARAVVA